MRSIHGEAAEWGIAEHLLAAVVDQQANGNWMFAAAHTPPRKRPPDPPEPVTRPNANGGADDSSAARGPRKPLRKAATTAEIAAFFDSVGTSRQTM